MSLHWSVIPSNSAEQNENADIVLHFTGKLTRDTLLPLWQSHKTLLADLTDKIQTLHFDFTDLTALDSAGFVMMCDIIHFYTQTYVNQFKVRLTTVSPLMYDLALLYDLHDWLNRFVDSKKG